MKSIFFRITSLAAIFLLIPVSNGKSQLSDLVDDVKKKVSFDNDTDSQTANGLKEAIEIGIKNAISSVSSIDGYYKNPDIKIFLPENVKKVEGVLRSAGLGSQLDEFEISMNRAAEMAAPEAKSIFMGVIRQMTFDDAKQILQGPDDAATKYFQKNTESELFELFKPIVQNSMAQVGVTNYYQKIFGQVKQIPFVDLSGLDLDSYVTDSALDGLFYMVAQEEKKIRTDPQARVTDLLKAVFGK